MLVLSESTSSKLAQNFERTNERTVHIIITTRIHWCVFPLFPDFLHSCARSFSVVSFHASLLPSSMTWLFSFLSVQTVFSLCSHRPPHAVHLLLLLCER